uniref:Sortilin N-terminal domain-containing protein n=1 Tax=Corethron hystrix TaxID=216773 RepID=A0A7S1G055_9STRA
MNPSNQAEFVVAMASGSIAHTKNRGDTLEKFSLDSLGVTDVITAMDWSTDGSYLYMGSQSSKIISCQVPISILNCERFSDVPSSFTLQYMAVDPTNPFNVVLTTGNDYGSNFEVWSSQDGGSTWSDITTEGSSVDLTYNGFAITWIYEDIGSSFIVVGTSHGVYLHNESSNWVLLAENLPNVRVYDMIYDKTDDLLIVSTLGRGIWYLENAYQSALDTWKS